MVNILNGDTDAKMLPPKELLTPTFWKVVKVPPWGTPLTTTGIVDAMPSIRPAVCL